MNRLFSMLGDHLFYAFTHALSETRLAPLNWTIKPSNEVHYGGSGARHHAAASSMIVWNANHAFFSVSLGSILALTLIFQSPD